MGNITYPSISSFVSAHASDDQQGEFPVDSSPGQLGPGTYLNVTPKLGEKLIWSQVGCPSLHHLGSVILHRVSYLCWIFWVSCAFHFRRLTPGRWPGICCGDVAVCVSVVLMCLIIMRPSPVSSPAVLVFGTECEPNSLRGSPSLWASDGRGVRKSRKIRPINRGHSPEGSS